MAILQYTYVPNNTEHGGPEWQEFVKKFGGFDAKKPAFKPFFVEPYSVEGYPQLSNMMDHIACAAQAGVLDADKWPQQLFKSEAIFDSFCHELSIYEECYRISDFWWGGLAILRGHLDEEGAVHGEGMVEQLRERIVEIREDGVKLAW